MRFFLLVILSLTAVTAHGQSIFKCKQHDGSMSYQDHPCPGAPNSRPDMTITPSDATSPKQARAQHLTPQEQAALARFAQSLKRLKTDLRATDAKRGHDWTPLPTPDRYATYEIQRNSVSYEENSKGEKTVVVVVQRHVALPQQTEMFKLHVTYADCKAGHGMLNVFDMNGNDKAVSAFSRGVNTDSGALARAACAEAGVHE